MAPCRDLPPPQMPFIKYQAVAAFLTRGEVGITSVQSRTAATTARLIIEFESVYFYHLVALYLFIKFILKQSIELPVESGAGSVGIRFCRPSVVSRALGVIASTKEALPYRSFHLFESVLSEDLGNAKLLE